MSTKKETYSSESYIGRQRHLMVKGKHKRRPSGEKYGVKEDKQKGKNAEKEKKEKE